MRPCATAKGENQISILQPCLGGLDRQDPDRCMTGIPVVKIEGIK